MPDLHYVPRRYKIVDGERRYIRQPRTVCGEDVRVLDALADRLGDTTCPACLAAYEERVPASPAPELSCEEIDTLFG